MEEGSFTAWVTKKKEEGNNMLKSLIVRAYSAIRSNKVARRIRQPILAGITLETFEPREMLSSVQMSYEHPGSTYPVDPGQEGVWMGTIHVISDTDGLVISDGSLILTEQSGLLAGDVFDDVHLWNGRANQRIQAFQGTGTGTASRHRFFGGTLSAGLNSFDIFADLSPDLEDGNRVRASLALENFVFAGRDIGIEVETIDGDPVDVRPDRSMLVGAWLTIEEPRLDVTVENIGITDTVVRNERDVNLLRFTATTSDRDMFLTDLIAEAEFGSAFNAFNYSLWVDVDGDSNVDIALQQGVAAVSFGYIRFQNLIGGGYAIQNEEFVAFEIHADIASSPVDSQLQLGLAGLSVEHLNDGSTAHWSIDHRQSSKTVHILDHGSVYVTIDTASVRQRDMLGGQLSDSLLRLNVRAENESIYFGTYIGFTAGPGYQSIGDLELFWAGETTPFGIATGGNARGDDHFGFTGFGEFIDHEDADRDLIIRARVKTDSNGSVSGDVIQIEATTIEARGATSAEDLVLGDGVYFGNTQSGYQELVRREHRVVHSKITSIVNANPASGLVPSGTSTIAAFRFAGASNDNVKNGRNDSRLGELSFFIHTNNVAIDPSSFRLYNTANSSTFAGSGTYHSVTYQDGIYVVFYNLADINATVDAGSAITLGLQANVLDSQVDPGNSSLQVELETDTIVWFDEDAVSSVRFEGVEYADSIIRSTSYSS